MAGELHASSTGPTTRPWGARYARACSPARLITGLGVFCALLLALPGVTITTIGLNDFFYTLDGMHRVLWGQVPNLDFHTALGPLAFYLPAMGYRLAGGYGGAMPVAMAVVLVLLSPLIAHVLASRLRPFLAVLLGSYLVLLLAAPISIDGAPTALSFAMFHDRIGWVALAALLVMYLRPLQTPSPSILLDAGCATLLTVLMIYTKITYGLAAVGFLLFMLSDAQQRSWAALALLAVAIVLPIVEFFWGGTADHVRDVLQTAAVSGPLGRWEWLGEHVASNATELLLLGLIAGIALWRAWRIRDAIFFTLSALAGLWIISHNLQDWGIFALQATAAIAAERILRWLETVPDPKPSFWINQASIKLVMLAMVLPTIVHCTITTTLHASVAMAGGGRDLGLPNMQGIRVADLWTGGDFHGSLWYVGTVEDGLEGLLAVDGAPAHVVVLGRANPFTPVLGLEPARGDMPELYWERTLDETHYLPPEDLFADARIVVEPVSAGGIGPVGDLYLPYLVTHFDLIEETEHWRIFRRIGWTAGSAAMAESVRPAG